MRGRPRKLTRMETNRAYYFDHPFDFDKPTPVEVYCPCKKLMFHFELAKDATVVVFKTKCPYCLKAWMIKVRNNLKIEFYPDERDEWAA